MAPRRNRTARPVLPALSPGRPARCFLVREASVTARRQHPGTPPGRGL